MAIRRGYVDTRIGQIHYRGAGTDPGPPLILLHQTASSSAMYERVMWLLDGHYRLAALDPPGFGQSDFPPPQPSVHDYATTLLEALTNLGFPRFHVFGHHTGASIACAMAATAPERVANLIPLRPALPAGRGAGSVAGQGRAHGHPAGRQPRAADLETEPRHRPQHQRGGAASRDHRQPARGGALARGLPGGLPPGYAGAAGAGALPDPAALRPRGPAVPLFPSGRARPDAKAVTIDKGSYVLDDDPARVAAEIRTFLTESGAA